MDEEGWDEDGGLETDSFGWGIYEIVPIVLVVIVLFGLFRPF